MAVAKKQSTRYSIPSWCLDALVEAPSAEEVSQMTEYLATHHDVSRLTNITEVATFALMVRDHLNGVRCFGNDSLQLLTMRDPAVIRSVLEAYPAIAAPLISQLAPADKKPKAKPQPKKVK